MTITSKGYGGAGQSIDTVAWADMAPHLGAAPHVVGGLSATVTSAVDRTVQIGTGTASGWGIFDEVTAPETLTFDSEASSNNPRWDAAVLRRDWEAVWTDGNGVSQKGRTTLAIVKGAVNSASPLIPTLNDNPGVLTDQLLFLLPVTNTGVGTQIRSTLYSGGSALYVPSPEAFDAMDPSDFSYGQPLTVYRSSQFDMFIRRGSDAAPKFENILDPDWVDLPLLSSVRALSNDRRPQCRVRGGMLELSGVVVPASGVFEVSGGVNKDYDLAHIPNSDWIPKTTRSAWVSQYGQGTNIEVYAGFSSDLIQAHVYGANTGRITLDNISLRIEKAS